MLNDRDPVKSPAARHADRDLRWFEHMAAEISDLVAEGDYDIALRTFHAMEGAYDIVSMGRHLRRKKIREIMKAVRGAYRNLW